MTPPSGPKAGHRRDQPDLAAASTSSWATTAAVRKSMRANRSRDTRPELAVRRALHALGLRYRVHVRPFPEALCKPDIVFTRRRVVVFVDGCYWHGCPLHHRAPRAHAHYWAAKVARNVERDRETDRQLTQAGWLPLRVWEHEDPEEAAHQIAEAVKVRYTDSHPIV